MKKKIFFIVGLMISLSINVMGKECSEDPSCMSKYSLNVIGGIIGDDTTNQGIFLQKDPKLYGNKPIIIKVETVLKDSFEKIYNNDVYMYGDYDDFIPFEDNNKKSREYARNLTIISAKLQDGKVEFKHLNEESFNDNYIKFDLLNKNIDEKKWIKVLGIEDIVSNSKPIEIIKKDLIGNGIKLEGTGKLIDEYSKIFIKNDSITEGKLDRSLINKVNKIDIKVNKDKFTHNILSESLDVKGNGKLLEDITIELSEKNKTKIDEIEGKVNKDASNLEEDDVIVWKKRLGISELQDIEKLNNKIKENKNKILSNKGGIAIASAIANIPQVSSHRLFGVGLGVSYYGKTGAISLGILGQDKNERINYKVSGGVDFKGNFSLVAGINYSLFKTNKIHIEQLKSVVNKKRINKLKKENMKLKNKLDKIEKQLVKDYAIKKENSKHFIVNNFDLDKLLLKDSMKQELVKNLVGVSFDSEISIIGYADVTGSYKYKSNLGLKRAIIVKLFLESLGFTNVIAKSMDYTTIVSDKDYNQIRKVELFVK